MFHFKFIHSSIILKGKKYNRRAACEELISGIFDYIVIHHLFFVLTRRIVHFHAVELWNVLIEVGRVDCSIYKHGS